MQSPRVGRRHFLFQSFGGHARIAHAHKNVSRLIRTARVGGKFKKKYGSGRLWGKEVWKHMDEEAGGAA